MDSKKSDLAADDADTYYNEFYRDITDTSKKFVFPLSQNGRIAVGDISRIVPDGIQTLIIPDGYIHIGSEAFSKLDFEEIILPNSVLSIDEHALIH